MAAAQDTHAAEGKVGDDEMVGDGAGESSSGEEGEGDGMESSSGEEGVDDDEEEAGVGADAQAGSRTAAASGRAARGGGKSDSDADSGEEDDAAVERRHATLQVRRHANFLLALLASLWLVSNQLVDACVCQLVKGGLTSYERDVAYDADATDRGAFRCSVRKQQQLPQQKPNRLKLLLPRPQSRSRVRQRQARAWRIRGGKRAASGD